MKQLRFRVEAIAFRLFLGSAKIVPRRVMLTLGGWIGRIGYVLDGRHRRITQQNLRLAYGPSADPDELRRIARGCWSQLGRNILDILYFSRLDEDSIGTTVHYEGLEHVRKAYARGKGVLLFSGHFGQWELTALMQGFVGLPLILITRALDNPTLERMLAEVRGRSGNRVIHKRKAVREMVKALRKGIGVAIVIDQDALKDGLFVPFFGRLASTTPTLARIAIRTGAAIVPTFSVPANDGTYRIVYGPEVEVRSTDDIDGEALRITAECTAILEKWVRAYPQHWFWMHRRWKTRPPAEGPGDAAETAVP